MSDHAAVASIDPRAHHPHRPEVNIYIAVFVALAVLTVTTVLVSYWHLPILAGVAVAMMIATVKASLVATFFMHLKGERAFIYGILAMTVFFVLFLFILPISDQDLLSGRMTHTNVTAEAEAR